MESILTQGDERFKLVTTNLLIMFGVVYERSIAIKKFYLAIV